MRRPRPLLAPVRDDTRKKIEKLLGGMKLLRANRADGDGISRGASRRSLRLRRLLRRRGAPPSGAQGRIERRLHPGGGKRRGPLGRPALVMGDPPGSGLARCPASGRDGISFFRQGHLSRQGPRPRFEGPRRPGGTAIRDGCCARGHGHAAGLHQRGRVRGRGDARRLARARGLLRAGRQARPSPPRRRSAACSSRWGAARHRRGRRVDRRQLRHHEGAIVRERAVLASGVILTGGTPVYDLLRGLEYRKSPGHPRDPAGPSSSRRAHTGRGKEGVGDIAPDTCDRQVPRREDRRLGGAGGFVAVAAPRLVASPHPSPGGEGVSPQGFNAATSVKYLAKAAMPPEAWSQSKFSLGAW